MVSKKVVLFPKEQARIEKEAFYLLKKHQYGRALPHFDQLITFGISDIDTIVGKVTCLAELGKLEEAEMFIESQLELKNEYYYTYVHIYATLLFQFHRHQKVKQVLEDALTDQVDGIYKQQFESLLEINAPLADEAISSEITMRQGELKDAIIQKNTMAQWHLVNYLQQGDITPYLDLFYDLLHHDAHPVVKSVVISLLQANRIDRDVIVRKFNEKMIINPKTYPYFTDHLIYKDVLKALSDVEMHNPSRYRMAIQVLERFIYVLYPFVNSEDVLILKEAIVCLVSESMGEYVSPSSKAVEDKVSSIIETEQLYLSLLGE